MENATEFLSIALNSERDAAVPEWVHLLPINGAGEVETVDRRGPYYVADTEQIIANSFANSDRLPIDQDHATDLAAPKGLPAPARGWIVEMETRSDGIWGRVEWTETGRQLLQDRAYRMLSPVIGHPPPPQRKDVQVILRASLVNRPNMRGITALNQETSMSFQTDTAAALGLEADASEETIMTALNSALENAQTTQSGFGSVAKALGCDENATAADVVAAVNSVKDQGNTDLATALQSTVKDLSKTVAELQAQNKTNASEAFVDQAIRDKRIGVAAQRELFISLHQADPEGTEAIISGLPKLETSHTTATPPAASDTQKALNAAETTVASQMGLSAEDMAGAKE